MEEKKLMHRYLNSKGVIYLIVLIGVYILFNQSRWKKDESIIEWDVISYYAYLPATFIYKDITLDFTENYSGEHKFKIWYDTNDENEKFIRTSLGLSYLYAPFFFLGHLTAHIFDYDTGGYSLPYRFFLQFSSLFFLFIGLIYLRKTLLIYFKDWVVATVLLIISIATNLGYYTVIESAMSHTYNFALISIFVYLTFKWHKKPNVKYSILIGLLYGLITIIRPVNALVIIFFIFYDIKNLKELLKKINFFLNNWTLILIMILTCIIPWIPQMIYWKIVTGQFLFYSYGESGGAFFFNKPQIFNGLLSYRKGWLLYTPAMIFSIIGFIPLYKKHKEIFSPALVLFIIFMYSVFSWWCWWYGGGLSIRAMIDIYGILAFPLAAFITWIISIKKKTAKIIVVSLFTLICLKSGLINFQYKYGIIHFDSMTKETFWPTLLRVKKHPPGFWEKLCIPDYELAKEGIYKCNPSK